MWRLLVHKGFEDFFGFCLLIFSEWGLESYNLFLIKLLKYVPLKVLSFTPCDMLSLYSIIRFLSR